MALGVGGGRKGLLIGRFPRLNRALLRSRRLYCKLEPCATGHQAKLPVQVATLVDSAAHETSKTHNREVFFWYQNAVPNTALGNKHMSSIYSSRLVGVDVQPTCHQRLPSVPAYRRGHRAMLAQPLLVRWWRYPTRRRLSCLHRDLPNWVACSRLISPSRDAKVLVMIHGLPTQSNFEAPLLVLSC